MTQVSCFKSVKKPKEFNMPRMQGCVMELILIGSWEIMWAIPKFQTTAASTACAFHPDWISKQKTGPPLRIYSRSLFLVFRKKYLLQGYFADQTKFVLEKHKTLLFIITVCPSQAHNRLGSSLGTCLEVVRLGFVCYYNLPKTDTW